MDKYIILFLIILCIYYYYKISNRHIEMNHIQTKSDNTKYTNTKKNNKKKVKFQEKNTNTDIINTKFHRDYWDIIRAINKLIFIDINYEDNSSGKISTPDTNEILEYANIFIDEINNLVNIIDIDDDNNSWNTIKPQQKYTSGWDKYLENLGLQSSLYNDQSEKGYVKLINITDKIKIKYNNYTKYIIKMSIKKNNTNDQMLLKLYLILKDDEINTYKLNNILNNIIIMGYLSPNLNK